MKRIAFIRIFAIFLAFTWMVGCVSTSQVGQKKHAGANSKYGKVAKKSGPKKTKKMEDYSLYSAGMLDQLDEELLNRGEEEKRMTARSFEIKTPKYDESEEVPVIEEPTQEVAPEAVSEDFEDQ